MTTPLKTFHSTIEIGRREGSRYQRVIVVSGSDNIYSAVSYTHLTLPTIYSV